MGREKGQFKPGNKLSVGHGRPSLPPEIRAERRQNQSALIQLVARHFAMTQEEAMERLSSPGVSRAEAAVSSLIDKSIVEGDVHAFKLLMEIMCGKIPDHDDETYSDEELRILARAKEILAEERAKKIKAD